jgi:hypothetical protein
MESKVGIALSRITAGLPPSNETMKTYCVLGAGGVVGAALAQPKEETKNTKAESTARGKRDFMEHIVENFMEHFIINPVVTIA